MCACVHACVGDAAAAVFILGCSRYRVGSALGPVDPYLFRGGLNERRAFSFLSSTLSQWQSVRKWCDFRRFLCWFWFVARDRSRARWNLQCAVCPSLNNIFLPRNFFHREWFLDVWKIPWAVFSFIYKIYVENVKKQRFFADEKKWHNLRRIFFLNGQVDRQRNPSWYRKIIIPSSMFRTFYFWSE